jgi:hypothetical protein
MEFIENSCIFPHNIDNHLNVHNRALSPKYNYQFASLNCPSKNYHIVKNILTNNAYLHKVAILITQSKHAFINKSN